MTPQSKARIGTADAPSQATDLVATFRAADMQRQLGLAIPTAARTTVERFTRALATTIRTTALGRCEPTSVIGCVLRAAQLGLDPDPMLGRAYFVPHGQTCTLIVGYRGLIEMAYRSGEIASIDAHVVHELDDFRYSLGTSAFVHFVKALDDRGPISHAYAICVLKAGATIIEVMTRGEIAHVRGASKTGNVWRDHEDEMTRKTVIRRLLKRVPSSTDVALAVASDGLALSSGRDERGTHYVLEARGEVVQPHDGRGDVESDEVPT